jgi:phosphatidylserine/phosphatidylglycerophosphate/cardiolipin synthase-like enzyme
MFQRLMKSVLGDGPPPAAGTSTPGPSAGLVLSIPVPLREPLAARAPALLPTAEVFARLMSQARETIKIFSPYVDPTFTALAHAARAPIQVVTTLREARMKSSPVLERFATTRPLAVRYLHEKHAKSQMFQLHAKMILADSSMAYVGSANFTDTSLHYNFELGVFLEDRDVIRQLHAIFDYVFDFAAKPAEQL